jgi:PAS domain S-box-containing protein
MSAGTPVSSAGTSGHPRAARYGLPLRWRLILLVVSGIVPLVVFSLLLQYWAFRANVASMGNRALEQAHNLSVAVARELDGCIRGLQVMAAAPALRAGQLDLDVLRQRADALAAQFPGSSVTLLQKDGRELLNTRAPPGAALPASGDRETTERVFETGQPAVSGIYKASMDGRLTVAVDVPVKREDGRVAFVLSMHPGLQIFDSVIHQARVPAAWVIAVFDQHTLIVARSPNPEQFVGHPGALASSDSFTRNLEGFLEDGESLEGIRVLRAFSRTPPYDWTVGIGVPRVELTGPAFASANTTFAVGGMMLLISIALAAYAARRIAGPIESLRHLAAAPDRDALPALAPTGLPEVDEVAQALHTSEDERRRSRQAELVLLDAIDTMPEGFVIYDDQGRLVMCNQSYRNFYQENEADLVPGVTFEEILRAGVGRGRFPDAVGCEEEWIAERLRRQREPQEPIEQKLADGRWALMTKHSLANGWIVGLRVDITDLKGAEEALRVGEERFRRVVEAVTNAIIMIAADGTIEMVNAQAEAIFGYTRAELLGRPIEVLLPEHYHAHHPGQRNAFFAEPQARLMGAGRDLNAVRKDGREFPVEIGLSPIETADGPKVLASVIDITARRQAQRTQAYFAAIVESTADAIIAKDLNGVVTSWNKAAELIFGYSASEMVGEPITRLLPADRLDEENGILARVRRGERIDRLETVRRRKDGIEFPVSVTISPILGSSGEIIGASKIARDITERNRMEDNLRASEGRFRSIFGAVGEGIFISSPTGIFTGVNEAGCSMFGYTSDELIGGDIQMISSGVPPYSQHEAIEWAEKAIATGRPQRFDWQCKAKDGRLFWAEVSIRFASISGQNVVLAVVRDVTERQAIEGQLRQAQKMEAIGNLTGGMAHDFNNMLGVVVGNLDLARERLGDDEDLREMVGEALEAAWRGADLTRRLLAFARRQPLRPARIEVNALVSDTVRLLHRLLGEDTEVSLELGADIWPVMADPAQLEASLANLSTNARDAMPTGGRLIIATANRSLDADYAATHADVTPGDFVMIEVSDTGTGMSAETMTQIFEPFFTTKEQGKGTGLGLSMVFGFLKQSGGHVSVYSEVGQGTTFRLYLPRATAEGVAHEAEDARPIARGAGETVLVVEDNIGMRRVALRQLSELGYRVLDCDRAAAALEVLQRESVDLLFSDIVMPGGLDGVELARIAQERWPALKIVLTSGFPQARVEGNGGLPGGLNLLSKPYHKEELAAALRAALDG